MVKFKILILLFFSIITNAQEITFRKNINKDSLFNSIKQNMPPEIREEFAKEYNNGNEQTKEFLLFMFSMPRSNKEELIKNYESKSAEIEALKTQYSALVPKNFKIEIEFEPENKIFTIDERISIKIYKLLSNGSYKTLSQNWDLKPNSPELVKIIHSIGWTPDTLTKIKKLLDEANCISIENGKITTIGFARSGLGKYSYKIFDKLLTSKEMEEYNNGCEYIFYKKNIVLEYGGGATGPQCFEKD